MVRIPLAPSPHWVAFSHDRRSAYVTNHFSDLVTVLDLETYQVVTTVPRGRRSAQPGGLSRRDARRGGELHQRRRLDHRLEEQRRRRHRPGSRRRPQDVTYAPDSRHFCTANVDDGTIAVVDAHSGAVTVRIASGSSPTSVAVTPDGGRVFVTNFGDGTIRVLEGSVSP